LNFESNDKPQSTVQFLSFLFPICSTLTLRHWDIRQYWQHNSMWNKLLTDFMQLLKSSNQLV